jgi:hypothetical protein
MGSFVCTFCGQTGFVDKADLERHWEASAACSRNRNAVNAYQPGSMEFGQRPIMPGEATLEKVRLRAVRIDETVELEDE